MRTIRSPHARAARIAAIAALGAGLTLGTLMFWLAGEHNPQNVFHGAEWSSGLSWALVGGAWFAVGFAVTFVAVFVSAWLLIRFSFFRRTPEGGT